MLKCKVMITKPGPDSKKNPLRSPSGPHMFAERRGDVVKIHRANDLKAATALHKAVLAGEVAW